VRLRRLLRRIIIDILAAELPEAVEALVGDCLARRQGKGRT
jgi:hypothetical protein